MDLVAFKETFLRYILLPLLMFITIFVMNLVKKNVPIKTKQMLIYLLLAGPALGVFGLLGILKMDFIPWGYFICQVVALGLGIVHVNLMHKHFSSKFEKAIPCTVFECLLSLSCIMFGGLLYYLLFAWVSGGIGNPYWGATSLISFGIPLLFYYAYISFLKIPYQIYKTWQYQLGSEPKDFGSVDYDRLMVLNVELSKQPGEAERFRIKAKTVPEGIGFGDWFHRVIVDYNFKNPNHPIALTNLQNEAYYWIFYVKKSFFAKRKYIDFEADINTNNITENDVIICKRVINHQEEDAQNKIDLSILETK